MESSITVKIFSLIAGQQNSISKTNLLNKYNKKTIVQKRINRLKKQRMLFESKKNYTLIKIPTIFKIRRHIQQSIKLLFPL